MTRCRTPEKRKKKKKIPLLLFYVSTIEIDLDNIVEKKTIQGTLAFHGVETIFFCFMTNPFVSEKFKLAVSFVCS